MKQLLTILLMLWGIVAQAQIPAEVTDILKKCSEKSNHAAGTIIDMKLHVSAVIMSVNGTMRIYTKGDKSFVTTTMKAMGKELYSEEGFDGSTKWEYTRATDSDERDTLIITSNAKPKKGKYQIDLGIDKSYKKARLKDTGKFWEITFTDPKDKDTPKKTILRIVKDTYMPHQMEAKVSIATAKMTVTKVTIGVNDNIFVFDPKKYPGAVIVRK